MVRRSFSILLAALLCPWIAAAALAQEPAAVDAPAHISFVDGAAVLERDGRPDNSPASMPVFAGDRVRTGNGRVEILFADGSTLHLDTNTAVDFQSDEIVRLLEGRVRLTIAGRSGVSYRIDAAGAWAQITQPGEYRLSLAGDGAADVELAVLRGSAELVNEDGRTPLRAGERAFAHAGQAPSYAYVFNSAAWDAFDRWSEARRDQRLALSSQYLPDEVRPYAGAFDTYGSWQYQPTYGYVWYPRVSAGWRPYYYGRWTSLRPYGWTWIGADIWSWPTHHYGRWGFSAGAWYWIPGRHWAPAWVSWAYAPGYVSWCPLGWDNRPVLTFVNINVYNRGYRGYDPWRAWTVVPHNRFGSGYVNVNVRAVAGRVDPRGFRVRDTAPAIVGFAEPRASAPIRVPGTRPGVATPRGGYSGAPAASMPGTYRGSQTQPSDAREAFRSRGAEGAGLSGPGFPSPSRTPREPGAVQSRPGVAVPRSSGGQPSMSAPGQYGNRSATPRSAAPSPVPDRTERRAVPVAPRGYSVPGATPGNRAMPRGGDTSPGAYDVPDYRRTPSYPRRADEGAAPAPVSPPADYGRPGNRAMPRSGDGGYRTPAGPPAGYRSAPGVERPAPSEPPAGYRSMPGIERATPSAAPAGYPSAPGIERAAPAGPPPGYRAEPPSGRPGPSGPPPSAGPPRGADRPSGDRPSGDRPSGGRPSGGTAARRPGGGR